jgi:alanine dehydrogenase
LAPCDKNTPVVVTETMVEHMKKGAVIVDVSIDTGGCFETSEVTSHEKTYFIKAMYCIIVYQIFRLVILKQPHCLSNIITPYLIQIADDGGIEVPFAAIKD